MSWRSPLRYVQLVKESTSMEYPLVQEQWEGRFFLNQIIKQFSRVGKLSPVKGDVKKIVAYCRVKLKQAGYAKRLIPADSKIEKFEKQIVKMIKDYEKKGFLRVEEGKLKITSKGAQLLGNVFLKKIMKNCEKNSVEYHVITISL